MIKTSFSKSLKKDKKPSDILDYQWTSSFLIKVVDACSQRIEKSYNSAKFRL